MRCSTVTPGKLATFWRRPVRRLNSVDLPEFGGPMMATTCVRAPFAWTRRVRNRASGATVAIAHSVRFLESDFRRWMAKDQVRCGFPPQCDFRAIHAIHARFAARCAAGGTMACPGRNPSSIRRRAISSGRSRRSSTPASPSRSCASVRVTGRFRRSAWCAIDTHLQHQSVSASRQARQGPGVARGRGPSITVYRTFSVVDTKSGEIFLQAHILTI